MPEFRLQHRHLTRWFTTIVNQEHVRQALPGKKVVLANKDAEIVKTAPAPKEPATATEIRSPVLLQHSCKSHGNNGLGLKD